jgi:hypothetical protein
MGVKVIALEIVGNVFGIWVGESVGTCTCSCDSCLAARVNDGWISRA